MSVSRDAHISHSSIAPTNSCDGTFDENCDPSRANYNIAQVRNFSDIGPREALR